MQSEDPPRVGLQVNRINIAEKWIESELAGLELDAINKRHAKPAVQEVWSQRVYIRIDTAKAKASLVAGPQMTICGTVLD